MPTTKCGYNDGPGVKGTDLLVMFGPTLLVNIGFDPTFSPAINKPPTAGIENLRALVDTGATESCIDSLLAAQLSLPIVDRRQVSGIGGNHTVNMYLGQVYIPRLQFTIWGQFAGVDLQAGGQPHHALIGRTFLSHFTMVYEGRTGTVTLSND